MVYIQFCEILGVGLPPRIHNMDILEPVPIQDAIGRDTLQLACSASGNPVPIIEWSFNGVKFTDTSKDGGGAGEDAEPVRHSVSSTSLLLPPGLRFICSFYQKSCFCIIALVDPF